jgi:AcrR family transcriptional regulator
MPATRSQPAPDVRERILAEATRLFAARGFDGTSLQDIADAVGVTKPSLLYHFPSKDDLRQAVLGELLARWNDDLPRLLVAATSAAEQFSAVANETVRFLSQDPNRARVLLREVLDRPDEASRLIETHVRPWVNIIGAYIRKGVEQGRVHADIDPEAYVALCMNLVLANVAMRDSLQAIGPNVVEAQKRELLRILRTSLFRTTQET